MGFIFGGRKSQRTAPTVASGLQLQSSQYGSPIPIVYGTTRIAPNLIWYGDFTPIPVSSSGSGGKGGVGGGGGGKNGGGSQQYTYQVAVELGLCEGPIQGIGQAYVDKNITTVAALNMTTFLGSYSQNPWGYLLTNHASTGESHTVPASGPYTVTVTYASTFMADYGVTGTTVSVQFTNIRTGSPGTNQYTKSSSLYTFSANNAGQKIVIQYINAYGLTTKVAATIPNTAPYTVGISTSSAGNIYTDHGVTATASGYVPVSGAPAANQYHCDPTTGIYTFNSANAGLAIRIHYSAAAQAAQYAALNYHGIAHLDSPAYQLGSSSQLPNHNFEVKGVYSNSISGKKDADPSLVIADLLTNSHYGAEFPSARVGDLSVYQAYTIANGLWISPAYNQQASAASMLDEIGAATNSEFVWSSGLLTLVPYGDQSITANGYTYTAPSAPEYDLTSDDFIVPNLASTSTSGGSDPVSMIRKRPADAINSIKLECLNRNKNYNPAVIEAKDQALINIFGLRAAPSKQTHLFCDLTAGRLSAQLQLQRQAIRNNYQFTLDQRYIGLDPMDIVTLTEPNLGLAQQWVRILEITENDDLTLSMIAEEYLGGTASAPTYNFQEGSGYLADYNSDPGATNTPIIFEPPVQITSNIDLETWIVASGGSNWGGCDVYISTDGNNYKLAGRITGTARQGVTTATFPSGADPDITNKLSVDLSSSSGLLISGTQMDADLGHTLCYVGGELVAYQTAALTGENTYDLETYIRRGMYGTTVSSHASNSAFARLDSGIFPFPYDKSQLGLTIYIKLIAFNIWGGGLQALSDVPVYTHVIAGPPVPAQVKGFQAQQQGNVVAFNWVDLSPTDVGLKGYDIGFAAQGTTDWANFNPLTEAARATEMTNASIPSGTWTFGIRAHDIAEQLGPISTFDLTVTNENPIVLSAPQAPSWLNDFGFGGGLFVVHYTGKLIPQSLLDANTDFTQISPPAAPVLDQVSGGSMAATTFYVKITYLTGADFRSSLTAETTVGAEASLALALDSLLTVTPTLGYPASVSAYNVYVGSSSGTETLQNATPVAIDQTWVMPATGMISGAAVPAINSTGWEVFDVFVPLWSSFDYFSQAYDTGFDDTLRVTLSYKAFPGPGQTGMAANITTELETWLTGAAEPDVFAPWVIGEVLMRYARGHLGYINNGGTGNTFNPLNTCYFTDFTLTIDNSPQIENGGNVVVAPGGTAITFPTPYHTTPGVQCTPVSSTALSASAASITTTGFTAHVFNSSGTDVGGTINWTATGT